MFPPFPSLREGCRFPQPVNGFQPGAGTGKNSIILIGTEKFGINATTRNDFDVFPDGKKFLTNTITTDETPSPLSLVLNWTAELKK